MEEVLPQTGSAIATLQNSTRWYQAATLNERVSLLKKKQPGQNRSLSAAEKAGQRLARWKSLPPFRRLQQQFLQRLASDGLTEDDLLALLAQPAEEIQATFAEKPAWLVELLQAFAEPDSATLAILPLNHIGDPPTDAAFQALKPLLARGFARLQDGIADLEQQHAHPPFDPRTVGLLLLPHFLELILNKPAKALIFELNAARAEQRSQGETPEERFLAFLQQFAQPDRMLAFLEGYPVLARQLVEMVEGWVTRSIELLRRLCADWEEIRALFSPQDEPGTLSKIQEGKGDLHQGGRSVAILTWSSGLRLVYKPRSLAIDAHFQELLEWLNEQGCQPPFRPFKLLNKGAYGWCEFLSVRGCDTKKEVERFYRRMGGYLALLYVLEATDFHAENLMAVGEHPMFIDLESLFQPYAEKFEGVDTYGYELLTHSVRRCGLLPQGQWLPAQGASVDLSGLGARSGQRVANAANAWTGVGTNRMQMTKGEVELRLDAHRPTLQGSEVEAQEYEQEIVEGFAGVYRLLVRRRGELLNTLLPRFAHDEVRMLVRPTQQYALLHSDSFHPDVLRDALDRDWLFDRLWIAVENKPFLSRVIAAERLDLQQGDIPKFTTCPESRDLFGARGERIADFFPTSGLELVKRGIAGLGDSDMERQIWLIRASFACQELNSTRVTPRRHLQLDLTRPPAAREQFLAEASSIGGRLQQLALIREESIGWPILTLVGGQEWRPVPAGPDLYNGLPGIALFLAYLGALSGEQRFTEMARLTAKTLLAIFAPKARRWLWGNPGAFDGLGSLIYLFSHLGALWQDDTLLQEAQEMLPLLPELLNANSSTDITAGSAGCIAALLSLHTVAPTDATLSAAIQCGEHLLKHARSMPRGIAWSPQAESVPLAGMSHGNAGIALNLLRLAAVSKDERFSQAALAALEYERSVFVQEKRNWPDLREAKELPGPDDLAHLQCMTAWCHGAPGIGLARVASLQYHDNEVLRSEIEAAVSTTLAEGFGRNHSLCHGDMGNLELLLLAVRLLPEHYSWERTKPLQAALLESMRAQGWQCGIARSIETPGLMLGLAGIGYALLRLAEPERVPSVLLLAPPPLSPFARKG